MMRGVVPPDKKNPLRVLQVVSVLGAVEDRFCHNVFGDVERAIANEDQGAANIALVGIDFLEANI